MSRHIPADYDRDHAVSECDCGMHYIGRGPGCGEYPACCGEGYCDHCGELFPVAELVEIDGDREHACRACEPSARAVA
jgi:hypothetical protein